MFRRADWIHSKKGRGGGLEDSSSSDSDDDEDVPQSSQESEEDELEDDSEDDSEDNSGEEQLDLGGEGPNDDPEDRDEDEEDVDEDGLPDMSLLDVMADEFEGDEEMLSMCAMKKGDAWFEAGKAGKLFRGRPLTCVPCAEKKKVLLLNSVMLYQHFTSAQHLKAVEGKDALWDDGTMFRYADVQDKMGLVTGGETHQERLERVMAAVDKGGAAKSGKKKATKSKKEGKNPKAQKRKTRPGKRQRQEQKEARSTESAAATTKTTEAPTKKTTTKRNTTKKKD
jgi:hypothetical protein